MKKLYYISWNGTCARFTRCFDSKAERDKFEKEINPILAEQGVNIVLDCNSLDYISSSGLRVVLKAQKMVSARKGDMTLTGVKPQIKKVFDMTGFSRFLKIQ